MSDADPFKLCSTCKKPIAFAAPYFQCSVSTCNRPRVGLFFCTLECWNAHLPMMRHREAWAETVTAPTRAAYEQAERESERRDADGVERKVAVAEASEKQRRVVGTASAALAAPKEVLVVVSKLKGYVRATSEMNTSDDVIEFLSDRLRALCDDAIIEARAAGRKTVMQRDFRAPRR